MFSTWELGPPSRELRVQFQGSPDGLHNTGFVSEIICLKIDCTECLSQNVGTYIIVLSIVDVDISAVGDGNFKMAQLEY